MKSEILNKDMGVILFAHGSRDPLWKRPIEAVAERMSEMQPQLRVCCAYLELTAPDLATAAQSLILAGLSQIRIVPMFLGIGRHAREDLPLLVDQLRAAHPQINFNLLPSIGEDARLINQIAQIAIDL